MRRVALLLALVGIAACGDQSGAPALDVALREVARLDRPSDETDLRPSVPSRTAAWYATLTMAPPGGGVAVFDGAGAFVKELRAQGRGPGEFDGVVSAGFGPGDSLWAVDMFRAHLFTPPPALEFVRTITFTQPISGRISPHGFLSLPVFTSSDGMLAPNLRDWDGTIRARFGPSGEVNDIDAAMGQVALIDASRAWKANGKAYELTLFNAAGAVLQRYERTVDWFPANVPITGAFNAVRPPARIADLSVGADGRIWVLIRRAHPDWKPTAPAGGPQLAPMRPGGLPSASSFNDLFETVLEVLDQDSGRLLASRVLPGSYRGFVDGQHIAEIFDDDDGHITLKVWQMDLVEGSQKR